MAPLSASAQAPSLGDDDDAERQEQPDREWFKVRLGARQQLLRPMGGGDVLAVAALLGGYELGVGAQLDEHWMITGHLAILIPGLTAELAYSHGGWTNSGLMLWAGAGYGQFVLDCSDESHCPPAHRNHGPNFSMGGGPLLNVGIGYRWSFSDDDWAFMIGLNQTIARLSPHASDFPEETTPDQLAFIEGWYISASPLLPRLSLEW